MVAGDFMLPGVDAAQAASLAEAHNARGGFKGFDAQVEAVQSDRNMPPPPVPATPAPTSNADLVSAVAEHESAQIARHLDGTFAPPAMPYEYRLEDESGLNDAQLAANSELKSAFHAAHLPKFVVESIAANLATAARTLANETPEQMQTRIDSNKIRLQGMWGKEFDGNMSAVDSFLEAQGTKSSALKAFIANAAHAFTSLDLDLILQVAKYRAGKV
jgi:hypothetical protein